MGRSSSIVVPNGANARLMKTAKISPFRSVGPSGPIVSVVPVISGDPSVEGNSLTLTTAPVWTGATSSSYVWQINEGGWADVAASTDTTPITVALTKHIYDYRVKATGTDAEGSTIVYSNVLQGLQAPVLFSFVDNLDQDPPIIFFNSTEAGTLYWEFNTTATDPGQGLGDIGSGSAAVVAGANTVEIDLSAYPDDTGYIIFRVTNDAGASNVLTSQEITVPVALTNLVVNGTFDADTDWSPQIGTASISGGVLNLPANGDSAQQTVTMTLNTAHLVSWDAAGISSGTVQMLLGTNSSSDPDHAFNPGTTNGTITAVLWPVGTYVKLASAAASATATVDNVFVAELPANVVSDPLFDVVGAWTLGPNTTISGGQIWLNAADASLTQTGLTLTPGDTYEIWITALGDGLRLRLGGNAATGTHVASLTNGAQFVTAVAGSDGGFITIEFASFSIASRIRNIYVRKI